MQSGCHFCGLEENYERTTHPESNSRNGCRVISYGRIGFLYLCPVCNGKFCSAHKEPLSHECLKPNELENCTRNSMFGSLRVGVELRRRRWTAKLRYLLEHVGYAFSKFVLTFLASFARTVYLCARFLVPAPKILARARSSLKELTFRILVLLWQTYLFFSVLDLGHVTSINETKIAVSNFVNERPGLFIVLTFLINVLILFMQKNFYPDSEFFGLTRLEMTGSEPSQRGVKRYRSIPAYYYCGITKALKSSIPAVVVTTFLAAFCFDLNILRSLMNKEGMVSCALTYNRMFHFSTITFSLLYILSASVEMWIKLGQFRANGTSDLSEGVIRSAGVLRYLRFKVASFASFLKPSCYKRLGCFTDKVMLPNALYTLEEISQLGFLFVRVDGDRENEGMLYIEGFHGYHKVISSTAGSDSAFLHVEDENVKLPLTAVRCISVKDKSFVAGDVNIGVQAREKIVQLANPMHRWSYRRNGRLVHAVHYNAEGLQVAHVRHALAELAIPVISLFMKAGLAYAKIPRIYNIAKEVTNVDVADREIFVATIFAKSRLAGIKLRSFENCVCYTFDQEQRGPFINVGPQLHELIHCGAVREAGNRYIVDDPDKPVWVTRGVGGRLCVTPDRKVAIFLDCVAKGERIESKRTEDPSLCEADKLDPDLETLLSRAEFRFSLE